MSGLLLVTYCYRHSLKKTMLISRSQSSRAVRDTALKRNRFAGHGFVVELGLSIRGRTSPNAVTRPGGPIDSPIG
jgi:hypothetical protein